MKVEVKGAQDLLRIRMGLKLYARNCRAASGTLKGLGKEDQATALTDEADDVEARLIAMFDEQGTLPLETAAAGKKGTKGGDDGDD